MSRKKQNQQAQPPSSPVRPEAELESRLAAALSAAFPNISREQLVEQRRFTVRLGHETHEFDSAAQWEKSGRADVIIFHDERPLAVVELKREDLALTHGDYEQAQSYANQLTPRPPLVVVTNGRDTRIYDANTGQLWPGEQDAANAVSRLLANAVKLAAADMRWATEALMGRETGVWARIVRSATARLLAEMTDPPGQSDRAFAELLLFPRLSTFTAIKSALAGTLFTIVEGAAQSGKSSCLRELALRTQDNEDLAVLMLRGSGPGLFQSLANLFAIELEWNLTANDARQWLRRMSTGPAGPALLLAIDDVEPGTPMAVDLEELAGLRPGNKLNVILTIDRAERLVKAPNGRTQTAVGDRAKVIEIAPLRLEEFQSAQRTLANHKILFQQGAEYTKDYRAPWVLRTIYDDAACDPRYQDPECALLLPSALDLALVDAARRNYANQAVLLRGYRVLARCTLADEGARSAELALAAANGFVIRQDALSNEAHHAVAELKSKGAVRTYRHAGGEDIVVPTIPAAFLSELADATGDELARRAAVDPQEAGTWLGNRLAAVYLGDLVGAQAIRSMAEKTGGFSSGIIDGLLAIEPTEEPIENALVATAAPDGRLIHLKIEGEKAWLSNRHGDVIGESVDLGAERPHTHDNATAWMILGQLASLPAAMVGDDSQRMDAWVLLNIGQCPFPLLRANEEGLGHLEHDLGNRGRVLCQDQGPIEATTQAMADLLSRPWTHADEWVDAAIEADSLPLLHRLTIALRTVQMRNIPDLSDWADVVLKERVLPTLTAALRAPIGGEDIGAH
ncbi:TPA: type I restriction enzyme HsdR N-terminal domain-containing protein [Pseudomonas aeruginosa]|uniref:type I restriction enzyme HsdR N-terminal domain-containing protein n=1 Tax=Pseudomonas aeruginosa TaxID=287 RepID=UPI002076341E|nr:type I restriction enzyme HsdR N-terminal domain-containing protein [Pseudomonas aeruginosa]MDP5424396.1 type I restriction enzyme HsdR N-terminal domain-containing protein [Pseudomonas aeruginosa]HBO2483045.1 type I restriction enzyme HsdR N-terminal domain-containing protein [Pseudomonas aeruginosa]HBP6616136.1 type I restriction endonuclease [Pseudomonas aeruginosa]HCK7375960.1 type I restriction enzyme HsdR N-terminal domain-containing protein [Pseudomonas aeruginosa]HDV4085070.1 type I